MDVYHQVLLKLNEATGGKDSKTIDFRDLVKKMGFIGHYNDIFERLNREGWIIETAKADFVSMTHWGVAEAKRSLGSDGVKKEEQRRAINRMATATRELAGLLENFAAELANEDFPAIEQKFSELENLFIQAKNKLI